MTSLLVPSTDRDTTPASARSLVLTAASGAVSAVLAPLAIACAIAVIGWFVADAAAHGDATGAVRVGAGGWLAAHFSGVRVHGTLVTAAPLLLTLGVSWWTWRSARRVGESVSGHGPDALRISDGERDWTVPAATTVFTATYLFLLLLVHRLVAPSDADPSAWRALAFALVLCVGLGGTAIAIGSGRAAVWATFIPAGVRAAGRVGASILRWYAAAAALAFAIALLVDFAAAANIVSQLDTDAGDTVMIAALSMLLLPNAVIFSGTYLLGPGFAVGSGTLVTPTAVVLGPLPLFPLLAALPGDGEVAGWVPLLMAVPVLVAAWAAYRVLFGLALDRWDSSALWGAGGGMVAAVVTSAVAALSSGAVGPGRMTQVGPASFDVLIHAVPAFALGGALGGVLAVWRTRRATA